MSAPIASRRPIRIGLPLVAALLAGALPAHAAPQQEADGGAAPRPAIRAPELVEFAEAAYPEAARAARLEGEVGLLLDIDAEGAVRQAEVVEPAGHGFDEAAREAALRFRFLPALRNGTPVPSRIRFRYTFALPPEPAAPPEPQQQEAPPAEEAIEVVVRRRSEAERLRESADAVQVVEIGEARLESVDLGEILARTHGVSVRRDGGLGSTTTFSLNGFSGEQIRFFLDGVPLEISGYPFGIANVPVTLVERVEVYRGVVPIRFGADALGGAVNLVSAPLEAGTHGCASYQLGSWGTHRFAGLATHLEPGSGFYVRAGAFYDRATNDYPVEVKAADERGRESTVTVDRFNDAYEAAGGNVEVGVVDRPWARRLALRAYLTDYEKGLQHNPVMTWPYGDVGYGGLSAGTTLQYENRFADAVEVELTGGWGWSRSHLRDVGNCRYNWFGSCVQQGVPELDADGSDDVWWDRGAFGRAVVGWEFAPGHTLRASVAPQFTLRDGDDKRRGGGVENDPLRAEREMRTVVSGLAYEVDLFDDRLENVLFVKDYRQTLEAEDPQLGGAIVRHDTDRHRTGFGNMLRWRFAGRLYGKASYEWATRLPRPYEVFGDGVLLAPNMDLQPETSHNFNLGLELDNRRTTAGLLRGGVNLFRRDAAGLIALLARNLDKQYQNVSDARATGVEAAAGWTSPGDWVALDANLTWLDFRNTSEDGPFARQKGDRIPNQPWLFANFAARFGVGEVARPDDRLSLVWNSRWVEGFFRTWESEGNPAFKQSVPAQFVHALALIYQLDVPFGAMSFTGEAQNLSDARVFDQFGAQRPGRSLYFKTTASF